LQRVPGVCGAAVHDTQSVSYTAVFCGSGTSARQSTAQGWQAALICIKAIEPGWQHKPAANPPRFAVKRREEMADAPVEVKKSVPATTGAANPWQSLRSEMDRLFDRFASGWGMPSLSRVFDVEPATRTGSAFSVPTPAMDISEDAAAYRLTAELPGLTEKDVEVVVTGETLTIKGEKQQAKEQKEKNFYLSERSYGSFQRSFALPDGVESDKIAADFANGVLTVTLPKSSQAKVEKKIEVKAAA
jgi:HSP20 family protein